MAASCRHPPVGVDDDDANDAQENLAVDGKPAADVGVLEHPVADAAHQQVRVPLKKTFAKEWTFQKLTRQFKVQSDLFISLISEINRSERSSQINI